MIALSGMRGVDIEIAYTGLQPGEKLYEEIQHVSETLQATSHARVLSFIADARNNPAMDTVLQDLGPLLEAAMSPRSKRRSLILFRNTDRIRSCKHRPVVGFTAVAKGE